MLEAIKGAAAMAIVITAAMIVLDSAWTGDFAPWGAVLAVGLIAGGALGWRRSRWTPEITIRDCRHGAASTMLETAAAVMPPPVATPEPPAKRVIAGNPRAGGCA